jgi:hypothetical protein
VTPDEFVGKAARRRMQAGSSFHIGGMRQMPAVHGIALQQSESTEQI